MPTPVAIPCGPSVDVVLRRARDAGAIGTTRAEARLLLSIAHRLYVAKERLVLDQATFTTSPRRLVYDLAELTSDITNAPIQCVHVDAMLLGSRVLPRTTWTSLVQTDRRWLRRMGGSPVLWAPYGRDHVILYPGTAATTTVVLRYVPLATALATDDDIFAVREDRLPAILDLAEALLLLRGRQYDALTSVMARLGLTKEARHAAA